MEQNSQACDQQAITNCTFSFYQNYKCKTSSNQLDWAELKRCVSSPRKGVNNKQNLPCLAAHSSKHKTNDTIKFMTLLWVDIDTHRTKQQLIEQITVLGISSYLLHTTFSSEKQNHRWRI